MRHCGEEMIRKIIIVTMTLVSVGSVALWGYSHLQPEWHAGCWEEATILKSISLSSRICATKGALEIEWYTCGHCNGLGRRHKHNCTRIRRFLAPLSLKLVNKNRVAGIRFYSETIGQRYLHRLVVPSSYFVVVSFIITMMLLRTPLRRWRRKRKGFCINCGYDLRGSCDVCPECGRPM